MLLYEVSNFVFICSSGTPFRIKKQCRFENNVPEKKAGISLLTLTFAVLSSSLNRKGVVARLEKVNDFETRFASPELLFQKVKK